MKTKKIFFVLLAIFLTHTTAAFSGEADVIRSIVYDWRNAWVSKDIAWYLSFYSPRFRTGSVDYPEWVKRKTAILQRTQFIDLELSSMNIRLHGRHRASVIFHQQYISEQKMDTGRKQLIFQKTNAGWKIISETWEELADQDGIQERITIHSIRFDLGKDGKEKVFIRFNRKYIPEIIALQGEKPRIALDIAPIAGWEGSKTMPTHGELVEQIRTHLHQETATLRIVLDLNPKRNYHVNPTYFRSENIYYLEIDDAGARGTEISN